MTSTPQQDEPAAQFRRRLPTDIVAVYPSATLRPTPGFSIAVPKGWEIDEAPDSIGVLRVPEPIDGLWVNLIITADRIDHRIKLAHAATITLEKLKAQCPDLTVAHDRVATFDGRLTSLRLFEMTNPANGQELTQVQGLSIAEGPPEAKTRDLFQLTGTCARKDADRFAPVFIEVIASFRFQ